MERELREGRGVWTPIPGGVPGAPGGVPGALGWAQGGDQARVALHGLGGLFQLGDPGILWLLLVFLSGLGELLVDELCLMQLGLTFGRKLPHFFGI